jgi:DNA-binding NarL/FixJ family response regulator
MKSQDEQYIIELIREGKTNKEIAIAILTTEQTVKDRVHKLLRKYNCKNRTQLAQINTNVPHGTI